MEHVSTIVITMKSQVGRIRWGTAIEKSIVLCSAMARWKKMRMWHAKWINVGKEGLDDGNIILSTTVSIINESDTVCGSKSWTDTINRLYKTQGRCA
ncbi:hypothetical protein LOK49_LG07G00758 [Camellia lanceoleosa]|uniref:Uncharacterized protein n=1 Tax=Camellia lanceoleosa TaxID=1840588 RepID=A0ACC0H4G3_9ERIC|nr:hypothetical protein LOK49_LG07G00758 [Camellia lanceoleosa]